VPTARDIREEIVDREGKPLGRDAAVLLQALDRLLTVGAYYSNVHEQYLHAVAKACKAIVDAISPRPSLAIEISANGLLIEGQTVDPQHRVVRKLHELLVTLDIARLEFSALMEPAHLQEALDILQEQRTKLGMAEGFRQINIEDLPPTLSIASRRIGHRADLSSLDDLLRPWEGISATGSKLDEDSAWDRMAREFMSLAERLLENLEWMPSAGEADLDTGRGALATVDEIKGIRDALQRLLEIRPTPSQLQELIRNARLALELSCDSGKVDLVFQILRKEMGVEIKRRSRHVRSLLREDEGLSVAALQRSVADLRNCREEIGPVEQEALRDLVAITLRLLSAGLQEPFWSRCLEALCDSVGRPDLDETCLAALSGAFRAAAAAGADAAGELVPPVVAAIRKSNLRHLATLWRDCVTADDVPALWPHLVNDLLLGLGPAPESAALNLWLKAGAADPVHVPDFASALSELSSSVSGEDSPGLRDLVRIPVAKVVSVHGALMRSRLANRLGPHLHRALLRNPDRDLTRLVLQALRDYDPKKRHLYVLLLDDYGRSEPSPRLSWLAGEVIASAIDGLTSADRGETWVPEAVLGLPRLIGWDAEPLLRRILGDRRFLILPAWPAACRRAARTARRNLEAGTEGAV
jgi:hypothetical protein